jgi:hypothetical protein
MTMDTDLDGFTDGIEVHLGSNPLAAGSSLATGEPLGATLHQAFDTDDVTDDDPAAAAVGLEMH